MPEAVTAYQAIVKHHESESARRRCPCMRLADKLVLRARAREGAGDAAGAAMDRARAEALACPTHKPRLIGAHGDENRLYQPAHALLEREDWAGAIAYLDHLIGKGLDGHQPERDRFARALREQAEVHRRGGDTGPPVTEWTRARALTEGITVPEPTGEPEAPAAGPQRYVDLVE